MVYQFADFNRNDDEPSLTDRELEVLCFVALGLSNKEMAKRLDIAPRTVERHIENTRNKMRARNKAHLVAKAIARGLLRTGPANPPGATPPAPVAPEPEKGDTDPGLWLASIKRVFA
jgi:DNA-binding CsgD family transcriptional regulator